MLVCLRMFTTLFISFLRKYKVKFQKYKDKKKIIRTINEHNYKNRLLTNKITYASLNIILTEC